MNEVNEIKINEDVEQSELFKVKRVISTAPIASIVYSTVMRNDYLKLLEAIEYQADMLGLEFISSNELNENIEQVADNDILDQLADAMCRARYKRHYPLKEESIISCWVEESREDGFSKLLFTEILESINELGYKLVCKNSVTNHDKEDYFIFESKEVRKNTSKFKLFSIALFIIFVVIALIYLFKFY